MAQFPTGLGLAVLGGCILGAAAISSHRLGGEAFAQGTGGERRIVSASVFPMLIGGINGEVLAAQRTWSDNTIDFTLLGHPRARFYGYTMLWEWVNANGITPEVPIGWRTVDNGTSSYLRADVDESRSVDAGDISAVLLNFGSTTDNPPPPIDCTINAPR